jgi:hypothetical protein
MDRTDILSGIIDVEYDNCLTNALHDAVHNKMQSKMSRLFNSEDSRDLYNHLCEGKTISELLDPDLSSSTEEASLPSFVWHDAGVDEPTIMQVTEVTDHYVVDRPSTPAKRAAVCAGIFHRGGPPIETRHEVFPYLNSDKKKDITTYKNMFYDAANVYMEFLPEFEVRLYVDDTIHDVEDHRLWLCDVCASGVKVYLVSFDVSEVPYLYGDDNKVILGVAACMRLAALLDPELSTAFFVDCDNIPMPVFLHEMQKWQRAEGNKMLAYISSHYLRRKASDQCQVSFLAGMIGLKKEDNHVLSQAFILDILPTIHTVFSAPAKSCGRWDFGKNPHDMYGFDEMLLTEIIKASDICQPDSVTTLIPLINQYYGYAMPTFIHEFIKTGAYPHIAYDMLRRSPTFQLKIDITELNNCDVTHTDGPVDALALGAAFQTYYPGEKIPMTAPKLYDALRYILDNKLSEVDIAIANIRNDNHLNDAYGIQLYQRYIHSFIEEWEQGTNIIQQYPQKKKGLAAKTRRFFSKFIGGASDSSAADRHSEIGWRSVTSGLLVTFVAAVLGGWR